MSETELGFETTPDQDMAEITFQHAWKWQQYFDTLTDYSNIDEIRNRAVAELDGMYPYKGQFVFISGRGIHTEYDEEGREPVENWCHIETEGQHNGFAVVELEDFDTKRFVVMQQIFMGYRAGLISKGLHQQLTFFDYLDLNSLCIPAKEIQGVLDENQEEVDLQEQMDVVMSGSKKLVRMIADTGFRRMSWIKQRKQLDSLVRETDKESKLRGAKLQAVAEYGYIAQYEKNLKLSAISIRDRLIGGVCLGVESLENLVLRVRPIRNDGNLVNKYAGLCLVIDPNCETKEALRMGEHLLYVPIGQEMDLQKITNP